MNSLRTTLDPRPGRRTARRTERGSTLVFVLVIIMVVGLIGGTVLSYQSASMKTQQVYGEVRDVDLWADAAIDTAIQTMRGRAAWGRTGRGAACRSQTDYADAKSEVARLGDYKVECTTASAQSGNSLGARFDPLPNTLLALGGRTADGNPDPAGSSNVPFCHNSHHGNTDSCEAGIWIGPGTSDNNALDGSVTVARSAPESTVTVKANGSIQISDGDRFLKAEAGIESRYPCDLGTHGGLPQIQAGWNAVAGTRSCDAIPRPPMELEPDYHHGFWAGRQTQRETVTAGNEPPPIFSGVCAPGDTTTQTCNRDGGVPTACAPMITFYPGWYTDAAKLNWVFQNCGGALFWFTPGLYYFDLDAPLNSEPRQSAHVVGGTPLGWNPGVGGVGLQTDKGLNFNSSNAANWPQSTIADGEVIDGIATSTTRNAGAGSGAELQVTDPETTIPGGAATAVTSVKLKVAHATTSDGTNGSTIYQAGFPRIEIQSDHGINGTCSIPVPRHTALATDTFTLTGGCTGAGAIAGGNWISGFPGWNAERVNSLRIKYHMKKQDPPAASVTLDGMRVLATYTGRPSPSYPGGCDPEADGVQFIFGNEARIMWVNSDSYVELCGSSRTEDPYGFAMYGLSEDKASPTVQRSTATHPTAAAPSAGYTMSSPVAWTGATTVAGISSALRNTGTTPTTPTLPVLPAASWPTTGLEFMYTDVPSSGSAEAVMVVPEGFVPAGSIIDRVEVRVRHREEQAFQNLVVTVEPQAETGGASQWASGGGIPPHFPPAAAEYPDIDPGADTAWQDLRIGVYDLDETSRLDAPQVNEDWKYVRSLTEKVAKDGSGRSAPEGINGAIVRFTAQNQTDGVTRRVLLDHISLVVEYRPPGFLRPLRGCTTTRVAENPQTNGYVGVDRDWGRAAGGSFISDAAYATTASGSPTNDQGACPLLRMDRGVKFHISGNLFAPTAALDLRANDNDASLVSGGIVARQITAYRWQNSGSQVPFGDAEMDYANREVYLRVSDGGDVLETAYVTFIDKNAAGDSEPGFSWTMPWIKRRNTP